MPNAPDKILSLSQLVEAVYVPHFRPSAKKSWLTTPCKKRITVVLVDSVWQMPLWQDSAHPRVLRSGTAIAGTLRPQEHNDDQISSDGTVAWERSIRHLHHIDALLTTCPADLLVKPNQALPAAQSAYRTHLATQESVLSPKPPSTFSHRTCYTSSTQSVGARPPKTTPASLHAHICTHRYHQTSNQSLLNTCVSLCVGSTMLSSRIMHAVRLRR